MHFICCMTPQLDVKILKLLQVQTSIHSIFVLQGLSKTNYWLIDCWKSATICKVSSDFGTNFQNTNSHHAKGLIMLRKLLLILCQRQKYCAFILSVPLSNLQTCKPVVPIIYTELKSLLSNLKLVMKPDVLVCDD